MTKVAMITGASRGIGRALTVELASRGISVIAVSQNEQALNQLKAMYPNTITIVAADITIDTDRQHLLSVIKDYKINYLVNNAGVINPIGPLYNAAQDDIRRLFDTNFVAPIFLTNALIPQLDDQDARILNITSVAGDEAVPGLGAYCISKAAMNMWTESLKKELPSHIHAANVIPGEVATHMQAMLRSAPLDVFPLAGEFIEAEKQDTLILAADCAVFLSDILLNTTPAEYSNKKWNIYQDFDKAIPQPLNHKKLAVIEVSETSLTDTQDRSKNNNGIVRLTNSYRPDHPPALSNSQEADVKNDDWRIRTDGRNLRYDSVGHMFFYPDIDTPNASQDLLERIADNIPTTCNIL